MPAPSLPLVREYLTNLFDLLRDDYATGQRVGMNVNLEAALPLHHHRHHDYLLYLGEKHYARIASLAQDTAKVS